MSKHVIKRDRNTPVVIGQQHFSNLTEAAKAFSLSSKKVHERVRCGWTIEEALELVERKLPSLNYQERRVAFAHQENLSLRSVETRLSVRRNRIREWLHLPKHSPVNHSNAVIVTDMDNKIHRSMKEAAKSLHVHRCNIPKYAKDMRKIKKYAFEQEMQISAETILLLCTHPNIFNKEDLFHEKGHSLLLDNQIRINLVFRTSNEASVIVYISIDNVTLFTVYIKDTFNISSTSPIFLDIEDLSYDQNLAISKLMHGCSQPQWNVLQAEFNTFNDLFHC